MVIVAVVLTVGVVAAAFVMLDGNSAGNSAGTDTQATGAPTAGTEAPTENAAGSSVEEERPNCAATGVGGIELPCLGGENGTAGADEGEVVVANVWAWWCGPCRDELPYLEEYAETHPEVEVVGVHADQNASNGAAFLNDLGVDLPSYQDADNTFAGTLGLPGVVPITVLFVGGEQAAVFPKTFDSAEEIAADVDAALAEFA